MAVEWSTGESGEGIVTLAIILREHWPEQRVGEAKVVPWRVDRESGDTL